jgi:hypothetical protein
MRLDIAWALRKCPIYRHLRVPLGGNFPQRVTRVGGTLAMPNQQNRQQLKRQNEN